ncbi:protein of unknown function [Candidatus Nitrotoga arctica]|uniref:Uncharacterized protein n=1 Tax=Candidatus Nitrotoga arctica TaxID=453162 RepID=A0ABN8ANP4_9PROT|nr:protein of unknown function [Candidatus Nitrotoga arctica]
MIIEKQDDEEVHMLMESISLANSHHSRFCEGVELDIV